MKQVDLPAVPFRTVSRLEVDDFIKILQFEIPASDFNILRCKIVDPLGVTHLAVRDHRKAVADRDKGLLRMNVTEPKILDRHVAEFLGISAATVSRAISKAKKAVESARTY